MLPYQKQSYHKLNVYQKAKELVLVIYLLTKKYPVDEKYTLVPQMRRAVISILANIVEGYSKNSRKDFARFLNISIGSATELNFYLEISLELNYLNTPEFERTYNLLLEVRKMLYKFQSALKKQIKAI